MRLLVSMLFLTVGGFDAVFGQRLTCPYELRFKSTQRVWCRQSSTECCTGLVFDQNIHSVDGDKLKVDEGSDSFTVTVMELNQGEGVYWCGVLSENNTIIKLAEGYFHSSASGVHVWAFVRWILLPLLLLTAVSVYFRAKAKHVHKNAEEPCSDSVSRALADLQYENVASLSELE
ncbi:hypothetical protein PAMP_022759 [Pampus punctatissimus]